ncbi:MAG: hypothetical protein AAF699_17280 [Pseudomonadota bacterium]
MSMSTPIDLWKMIKPVWRVWVPIAACQILGAIIDMYYDLQPDAFFSFYLGGVYAGPVGLPIGLLWHYLATHDMRSHAKVLGFIVILSIAMPLVVFLDYGGIS